MVLRTSGQSGLNDEVNRISREDGEKGTPKRPLDDTFSGATIVFQVPGQLLLWHRPWSAGGLRGTGTSTRNIIKSEVFPWRLPAFKGHITPLFRVLILPFNGLLLSSMVNATLQTPDKPRGLAGRPKKFFRDPLAPYVTCKCGSCPRCLDNAKWDKVFQKFVDPMYYRRPVTTIMRSPLAGL
jgi:hypothetical protein